VVKPTLDALLKESFVDLATANGDGLTAALLQESRVDTTRSQAWSTALARYAIAQNADNRAVIDGWREAWQPLADRAVDGLAVAFADAPHPADLDSVRARVRTSVDKFTESWRG
jgi:toluene monooxygenase system protein E